MDSGLYIRAGSWWTSPASLPDFAGYFHCFTSQDMLRRWTHNRLLFTKLWLLKNLNADHYLTQFIIAGQQCPLGLVQKWICEGMQWFYWEASIASAAGVLFELPSQPTHLPFLHGKYTANTVYFHHFLGVMVPGVWIFIVLPMYFSSFTYTNKTMSEIIVEYDELWIKQPLLWANNNCRLTHFIKQEN